jgi:hypothetical protein
MSDNENNDKDDKNEFDFLKDCVDIQIVIEKKRGYVRVNQ